MNPVGANPDPDRPATRPKVLVAMSGGVDSSVAAALLRRQGYDCVGVFMRLGSPGEALDELLPGDDASACATGASDQSAPRPRRSGPRALKIGHQGCCSINDAADARLVAAQLGIPFYVVNFKREFGRVIDYFVDEYASGRTPNPCVRCNDWLKFGRLHEYAQQLGAGFVASGHYARVESTGGAGGGAGGAGPGDGAGAGWRTRASDVVAPGHRLLRGLDHAKDQSYVLFGVPREQLSRMLLPIGGYTKAAIREMARDMGLPVFDKPDSQEICFVPDNDYAGLVERRRPVVAREGRVLDVQGREIGEHGGHHQFTIGQRRGVGVALGHRLYVVDKDPSANTVTLGPRERLLVRGCDVGEANWLVDPPTAGQWGPVRARYRSNGALVPARVRVPAGGDARGSGHAPDPGTERRAPTPSGRTGRFEIAFDEPQEAVAPGQALVLYDAREPEVVLGGGWIESAARA